MLFKNRDFSVMDYSSQTFSSEEVKSIMHVGALVGGCLC